MRSLMRRPSVGWLAAFLAGGACCMALPAAASVPAREGSQATNPSAMAAWLDQQLESQWAELGIAPSPPATDGEWCRRVYLDIIGRIPTIAELQEYVRDKAPDKRQSLVQQLLYDDRYAAEYTRNWTTIWTNLLIGRTGGMEDNSRISREGMQEYLRGVFRTNRSYDTMVLELITATGTTTPDSDKFNGATNFLCMKLQDDAVQATAKTAQLFLGMQVQCTQCHNHPFNEWKQNQFWELNAFFRQTVALRRFEPGTRDLRWVELADQDFAGEGSTPEDAEIYYELRNGLLKAAYPVFVDGTPLAIRSGYLDDVNRRGELGSMVVASPYLAKASVNRMWGHFFGYGFTKPVDDMGPHNRPSHPELLDGLAQQFVEHGYDLKQLITWITLSRAYGLSSRVTNENQSDDPLLGTPPQFSHFYLRQMRAEELYESLLVATQAHRARGDVPEQDRARAEWLRQFTRAFGTDEGDETTIFNGTIPQSLMMFNGELMREAVRIDNDTFLAQVIASDGSNVKKLETLFMAGLARRPTRAEMQAAQQLLIARVRDGARASAGDVAAPVADTLQDIWWAILNSNEFILNH